MLIPLFLGIFFTASLAVLRIPDGTVHYRRLFGWENFTITKSAGAEFLGFLELDTFV